MLMCVCARTSLVISSTDRLLIHCIHTTRAFITTLSVFVICTAVCTHRCKYDHPLGFNPLYRTFPFLAPVLHSLLLRRFCGNNHRFNNHSFITLSPNHSVRVARLRPRYVHYGYTCGAFAIFGNSLSRLGKWNGNGPGGKRSRISKKKREHIMKCVMPSTSDG